VYYGTQYNKISLFKHDKTKIKTKRKKKVLTLSGKTKQSKKKKELYEKKLLNDVTTNL
jgi:hypothetical protein